MIRALGATTIQTLVSHGRWGIFMVQVILGSLRMPFKFKACVQEIKAIGADSLSIIVFTALFTGMVLGLQGYTTLKQFGADSALGLGVTITLFSELGPVLAALLLTGRAGSSMCAQIGVMRISEQIDALETMGIDPFHYIISPKLIAGIISFPILTFLFSLVGIFGGYVAGVMLLGVNSGEYYSGIVRALNNETIIPMCFFKSLVFGILMVMICTFQGYMVYMQKAKGAIGVSKSTTSAVVFTSVNVLLWDYLLTSVLI